MYGLITRLTALPGRREELALMLLDPAVQRRGCHSYVVSLEEADPDALWVTEVWISEEAHRTNFDNGSRELLRPALALVAGFGDTIITRPIGGVGL